MEILKITRASLDDPKSRPRINALVRAVLQRANHESVTIDDTRHERPSLLDIAVVAGLVEIIDQ